jgi:mono/diheme cytochrome c family protein
MSRIMFEGRGVRRSLLSMVVVVLAVLGGVASSLSFGQEPTRDELIVAGRRVFAGSCGMAYCHGSDGAGGSGPRLRDRGFTAARLTKVITDGIPGTAMPAFGKGLKPEQITQLVAYLLSVNRELPGPEMSRPESSKEDEAARRRESASKGLEPHLLGGLGGRGGSEPGTVRQEAGAASGRVDSPARAVGVPRAGGVIGDWRSGQEIFFGADKIGNCRACHTLHGRGGKVASDLSRLSGATPAEIMRRLLAPRVAESPNNLNTWQFGLITVTLKSGERVTGIRRDESDGGLRVFDTATLPPVSRNYLREEIAKVERGVVSGCPGDYAAKFTLRQLLDLIALVKTVDPAVPATVTAEELFK